MTRLLSLVVQFATLDAYYFDGRRVVARFDADASECKTGNGC